MRKETTVTYRTLMIISGILAFIIGGAAGSCANNTPDIAHKLMPAYSFEIQFPADEQDTGTLTMEPGTTVILPVVARSLSDIPISIRLTQEHNINSPDFITLHGDNDYITLQPTDNITLAVTCTIAGNAAPGTYQAAIHGELEKPLTNRSTMSMGFRIIITK
jgi:hypothetical protein